MENKWLEMPKRKREHKAVTRCGCPTDFRIKSKVETSHWYVSRFVDEHNHKLLPPKFVDHLPSYCRMSDVDFSRMDSLRVVSISISKIYESIASHTGGFKHVSFTKNQCIIYPWTDFSFSHFFLCI
ncbi:hypothetical protein PIB30_116988 [Stylosanthes scabra]|uniref:FAR1 domain-containing protein n=1 Tax=Stylosanthes scabra TaxID=79078 RepID=A0ABU6T5K0_9FABA|nr:hypothetical protein [Stylosanthes scabra]